MNELDTKKNIERTLSRFSNGSLLENSLDLLSALGYRSQRQFILSPNTFDGLVDLVPDIAPINKAKALVKDWLSVDILFQLTSDDIRSTIQGRFVFDDTSRIDNQIIESYLFMAIRLQAADYPRGKLADLTREINKFFAMPVMILFQYGQQLTLSLINRRLSKREETKDVLEKVTLIKGINYTNPLRAHTEILYDLSLERLQKDAQFHNFVELHRAWQKVLDTSELNKRFYREVADWYFWAVKRVEYPAGAITDPAAPFAASVIRLITRIIFVWFIKEKGLVPHDLFNEQRLKTILNYTDPKGSTYYKAILQNLFFATLNTEMGAGRQFRSKNSNPSGLDGNYGISSLYRYQDYFKDRAAALELFANIPFLNGGLFECLDKREENKFIDGFSDNKNNQPSVPDDLFFGQEQSVDLNDVYGDSKHGHQKVRGIIHIFNNYKFTIEENTPLEEEIALDPELLGKVFENLLAAYNPETGTTARKQTGSFYTPREIVNYMVDESLIAYLEGKLEGAPDLQNRLHNLMAYNQEPDLFSPAEDQRLIAAIDEIKVLDPACGSGAFPMGMLHKLVYILSKLDPGNQYWKDRQIAKAAEIPDPTMRDQSIEDIEKAFAENELDYGRKLYLIENCIYGVDIQPIAVQVAKLRFFISLVVDQRTNSSKLNLGIRPLPNLETKFVAANTLIGIERPKKTDSKPKSAPSVPIEIEAKSSLLVDNFRQYLIVRNPALRESLLQDGLKLGEEINIAMESSPDWAPIQVQWIFETGKKLDDLRKFLPVAQPVQAAAVQLQDDRIKILEDKLAAVRAALFTARTLETKHKYREQDKQLRSQMADLLKTDGWGSTAATQLAGWDPYDQNASAEFFDPEWMFGVTGGFEIIVGNPPYIDSEGMVNSGQKDLREYISKNYLYTQGNWDIYIAFFEKSLRLLNSSGNLTFITPDKWLSKPFGNRFREKTIDNISSILITGREIFEGSKVDSIVTFLKKHPTAEIQISRYENGEVIKINTVAKNILNPPYALDSLFSSELNFLINLDSSPFRLRNIAICENACATSDAYKLKPYIFNNETRKETQLKVINTGTISKYVSRWGKKEMVYLGDKYLYPVVDKSVFLKNFNNTYGSKSIRPKIIIKGLTLLDACYDELGEFVPGKSTLVICSEDKGTLKFLLGLLNSKLPIFYIKQKYPSSSYNQGINFTKDMINDFPLPKMTKNIKASVITVVDELLTAIRSNSDLEILKWENEINRLVYEAYGLSSSEINLVEQS